MGEASPAREPGPGRPRAGGPAASGEVESGNGGRSDANHEEKPSIEKRGLVLREGSVTGTAVTGHVYRVRVVACCRGISPAAVGLLVAFLAQPQTSYCNHKVDHSITPVILN